MCVVTPKWLYIDCSLHAKIEPQIKFPVLSVVIEREIMLKNAM